MAFSAGRWAARMTYVYTHTWTISVDIHTRMRCADVYDSAHTYAACFRRAAEVLCGALCRCLLAFSQYRVVA